MADALQILVVEDDPDDRRLASGVLARAGHEVCEARSGSEALTRLEHGRADVVLVGLGFPARGGRELLDQIADRYPEAPAVVLSVVEDLAVAIEAMQRGASDYVVKRPDGGHLRNLPGIVRRTLERHRAARERDRDRAESEMLRTAVRELTDGVALLDPDSRIRFVNRALRAAWGRAAPDVVGRPLGEFVHVPGDERGLEEALSAASESGHWRGELHARGVEPPAGVWEVALTPAGSSQRPPPGARRARALAGIFRDVSGRHALEQLRADFLSMIIHDIKVPLTVILGYTEMLTDPEPPPGEIPPDILTRIRESGETIHALVCNFLDLSRIEAGRMTLDPRAFDLCEMLAHALEHYDSTARRKGIALALEAAPLPPLVADEAQLQRVVANLLANAIKYTPSGGRITVSTGRENGRVAVAFRDTGRGIPPDELPHLFEKYRRVREARRTEGTGLGLFIAKTIIDAHGGDIRVESEPGVGSTFTLLLPGI